MVAEGRRVLVLSRFTGFLDLAGGALSESGIAFRNSAVEAQAMGRAHRIGQTKSVFVYKLVARDTVEEDILALQARKAELAASIIEGCAASLRFTPEDLAELMRLLG